ncbi:MAG: hypothetical protein M1816_003833 [Peltula sp. TS41687]|nr:MAG: hypothetical protein M1816_003833 [Peltula sp. TS41687]
MPSTRSSTRQGSSPNPGQDASTKAVTGTKRASDGPKPSPKRGKKAGDETAKEQKTIEETMLDKDSESAKAETEMNEIRNDKEEDQSTDEKKPGGDAPGAEDAPTVGDASQTEKKAEDDTEQPQGQNRSAVIYDPEREQAMPSNILEKGIIYFFFRARVGIEDPEGVNDVARSYIVLRPIALGAKLGEGPLEDAGNNRLLALPKKVLPTSNRDRFMVFVEKPKTTLQDLKENFISGSDYTTKTQGPRHTPSATPSGEGVYAISTTGRESHLSYFLTVPSEINEVQKELGLRERASFVVSAKNPEVRGPANARLPKPADYNKEIMDEFRGRGWMPMQPRILDYENAQVLLIGEEVGDLSKALEPTRKDEKEHKETPMEEMEQLEHEDEIRVHHLKGDDPIFEDLGLSSKDHAKLQTTW